MLLFYYARAYLHNGSYVNEGISRFMMGPLYIDGIHVTYMAIQPWYKII